MSEVDIAKEDMAASAGKQAFVPLEFNGDFDKMPASDIKGNTNLRLLQTVKAWESLLCLI